jgi:photosystem II stability/assembly factor-like uncharacterized protein
MSRVPPHKGVAMSTTKLVLALILLLMPASNTLAPEARAFEPSRLPDTPHPLLATVTPNPAVTSLVEAVSGDTMIKYVSQLSGNEPVVIRGVLDTLHTRYTFSPEVDAAAQYLQERFEAYGLDVELQEFRVGNYPFMAGDFADSSNGLTVGTAVFRTADGGLSWQGSSPGTPGGLLLGVCMLDTLRAWVVGTDSEVFRSDDGGATWTRQQPPAGFSDLRPVAFLDSLNGWIAGASGRIAHTSDGGTNWTEVASGTGADILALQFPSGTRGWACGDSGLVLSWDGAAWIPVATGTAQVLYDIHFVDELTGWAVGENAAVLKTVDGGSSWTAQSNPAPAGAVLTSVWFASPGEGWVVGSGGIVLHTTDGGATWESRYLGTLMNLWYVEFVDGSHGRIAGNACAFLGTDDGGTTWIDQTQNMPDWAGTRAVNVVATRPGYIRADEDVIICGHYDSISQEDPMTLAPGADDDASGTSAVLEAARVMAGTHYQRTIRYICFGGEEQGLIGSAAYATAARSAGDAIVGVLDFDNMGYVDHRPEAADLLCDPASEWLADYMIECGAAYVPTFGVQKLVYGGSVSSDHGPFWSAGYSALTGYADIPPVNPHYHTAGDTVGHLTKGFMASYARLAVATLAELAVPDTVTAGLPGDLASVTPLAASPNPFSGETTITFSLIERRKVEAAVFDVSGRRVRTLASEVLAAGAHRYTWDGKDSRGEVAAPGIYFARVRLDGRAVRSMKLVSIR